MLTTKKGWVKIFGWLGTFINAGASQGVFGKYSPLAMTVGTMMMGMAVHNASETSAGHPNGSV